MSHICKVNPMITKNFNPKLGVLEVTYKGVISLKDILKLGAEIEADKTLPRDMRILFDATEAKYTLNLDELHQLRDAAAKRFANYNSWKDAMIHAKPHETAISILSGKSHVFPGFNYQHRVFATREAALHWLLV